MKDKYRQELYFAQELVESSACILDDPSFQIFKKEDDFVTSSDLSIENTLIRTIRMRYPKDFIISEETADNYLSEYRTWVIDPIDGTYNFVRGIPLYGIQMALAVNMEPVLGVIYLHQSKELYSARKGHGATLNGKIINTIHHHNINQAVITFGDFKCTNAFNNEQCKLMYKCHNIANSVGRVKMFGAAVYDFSFLASGKTDAHIMPRYKLWDLLPGYIICKESGVLFKNLDGSDFLLDGQAFAASANEDLLQQIVEILNS